MKTLQTVCKELLERIKHMERDREKLEYKTKFMGSDIYNIYKAVCIDRNL